MESQNHNHIPDHGPLRQVSGHWNKAREQDAQAVSPWYLTSCSVPERCSTGYHVFYTAKQIPAIVPSKKSPPNKYYDKKSQSSKGAVLKLVSLGFRVVVDISGRTCFSINSQLILTAAFRYFLLSSLSLPLISPILSRLSPRYRRSSIFFVMTLVTSFNSSFSLSKFAVALLS